MNEGTVTFVQNGLIGHILFDRPQARNAMTWKMYDELSQACDTVIATPDLRVLTLRGAGGKAFVAGTDISQFREFSDGEDGIEYEKKMEDYFGLLLSVPIPTVAIIEGWAVGGGLAIATACDIRIATPDAEFGVPIARTIGNCLSMENLSRLVNAFGVSQVKKMLLLSETLTAEEAETAGFLCEIVPADNIGDRAAEICARLIENAPITLRTMKQALGRLTESTLPNGDDLIRECYGSEDFKTGVEGFFAKKAPVWAGK